MRVMRADTDHCPVCGAAGIPILLGLPSEHGRAAGRAGRVVIGGCRVQRDGSDPQWQCGAHASHRWTDGDPESPRWLAAVNDAVNETR